MTDAARQLGYAWSLRAPPHAAPRLTHTGGAGRSHLTALRNATALQAACWCSGTGPPTPAQRLGSRLVNGGGPSAQYAGITGNFTPPPSGYLYTRP